MMLRALGVLLVGLMLNGAAVADTAKRIEGVSKFLLDRANDNWLYVTETQIKKNDLFRCYFPNTYTQMTSGNLKLLLNAGKSVWTNVVEEDLQNLADRYLVKVLAGDTAATLVADLRDAYIEQVLQQLSVVHNGQRYPLSTMPTDADQAVKDAYERFTGDMDKAFALLDDVRVQARQSLANQRSLADDKKADCVADTAVINKAKRAIAQLEAAVKQVREGIKDLRPTETPLASTADLTSIAFANLNEVLIRLLALDSVELSDLLNLTVRETGTGETGNGGTGKGEAAKSYVMRVLEAEAIIKRMHALGNAPIDVALESKDYARFRRYVLSVAVLSDAESADQVKVALQEMTLPPVSFGLKRQPDESTVMITSYLGIGAGSEQRDAGGREDVYGLYAPIGLEYSYGLSNKSSISVMLAPFDFAHPLNLELYDKEESVEWNDVVRPSVAISYGVKDYPFTIGLAVSRGRPLASESEDETQYLLFVAFDMPLFQVF